jgi:hypothetical protein
VLRIVVSEDVNNIDAITRDLEINQIRRAVYRAVSRSLTTGRKIASDAFREVYNLSAGETKDRIPMVITGTPQTPVSDVGGQLEISHQGVPLILYKARQVEEGVRANMQGSPFLVRSAFIATMRSGHQGAFIRAEASNKSSKPLRAVPVSHGVERVGRLPIRELWGVSPYQFFKANGNFDMLVSGPTLSAYRDNLEHELEYAVEQAKQKSGN